jgi:hypothetical protein
MEKISSNFWYCKREHVTSVLNDCLIKYSRYKRVVLYNAEEISWVKNTAYIVVKKNKCSKSEFKIIIKVCF